MNINRFGGTRVGTIGHEYGSLLVREYDGNSIGVLKQTHFPIGKKSHNRFMMNLLRFRGRYD